MICILLEGHVYVFCNNESTVIITVNQEFRLKIKMYLLSTINVESVLLQELSTFTFNLQKIILHIYLL